MTCTNNFCKSTLVATGYSQTIAANGTASFTTSVKTTGNAIAMNAANNAINLKKAGLYLITLSATGASADENGSISLQVNRNGVALTNGVASAVTALTTSPVSLSVSTIVEVDNACPCNSSGQSVIPITITNTGTEATYTFIILTVTKLA